jgi:TP901 family phage tail tape measure protein
MPGGLISVFDYEELMSPVHHALAAGAERVADELINVFEEEGLREAEWMTHWRRLGTAVEAQAQAHEEVSRALVPTIQVYRGIYGVPEPTALEEYKPDWIGAYKFKEIVSWWSADIVEAFDYATGVIDQTHDMLTEGYTILAANISKYAAALFPDPAYFVDAAEMWTFPEKDWILEIFGQAAMEFLTGVRVVPLEELRRLLLEFNIVLTKQINVLQYPQLGFDVFRQLGGPYREPLALPAPQPDWSRYLGGGPGIDYVSRAIKEPAPYFGGGLLFEHVFTGAVLRINQALVDYVDEAIEEQWFKVIDYTKLQLEEGIWTAGTDLAALLVNEFDALFPLVGKWSADAIATAFRQVLSLDWGDKLVGEFSHEGYVALVEDWLRQGLITSLTRPAAFPLLGTPETVEWWRQVPGWQAGYLGPVLPPALPAPEVAGLLPAPTAGIEWQTFIPLAEQTAAVIHAANAAEKERAEAVEYVKGVVLTAAEAEREHARRTEELGEAEARYARRPRGMWIPSRGVWVDPRTFEVLQEGWGPPPADMGGAAGAPPPPTVPPTFGPPDFERYIPPIPTTLPFRAIGDDARDASRYVDRFSSSLNEATMQYFGIRRVGYGMQAAGSAAQRMGQQMTGGLMDAAEAYWSFNEVSTRAAAAMELEVSLRDELDRAIIENSKSLGFFKPEQIAEGLRLWAAGTGVVVETQGELTRVVEGTVDVQKMALLNNANLGESMRITGAIMKSFDMTIDDTAKISEVLNYVAAKTFAEVTDVGRAFEMVGPVAAQLNIPFTELAATIALLSEEGLKGQRTGRALRQMFIQLQKPTERQQELMEELIGVGWEKMVFPEGMFVGIAGFIDLLAASTENLTQQERGQAMAVLATANELPTLTALVENQIEARAYGINVIRAFEKAMLGVVDAEVYAYQKFVEQQTGMPFSLESAHALMTGQWEKYERSDAFRAAQMKMRWEATMLKLGQAASEALLPLMEQLARVAEILADIVAEHPLIIDLAIGFGGLLLVVGKLVGTLGTLAGALSNVLILWGAFSGARMVAPALTGMGLVTQQVMTMYGPGAPVVSAAPGWAVGALGTKVGGALATIIPPALALAAVLGTLYVAAKVSQAQYKALIEENLETAATEKQFLRLMREARYPEWAVEIPTYAEVTAGVPDVRGLAGVRREIAQLAEDRWETEWATYQEEKKIASLIEGHRLRLEAYEQARARETLPRLVPPPTPEVAGPEVEAVEKYFDMLERLEEGKQDYLDRVEDAERNHWRALEKMQIDYERRRAKMITDYTRRREELIADAEEAVREEEENQAERRQKLVDEFNRRVRERYEDHLKSLRRMREDHEDRMGDLITARDATGALREIREYRKRRGRAQEDYRDWLKRQQEAHGRDLRELDEHLEEMRRKRQESLEEQLRDLEENHLRQLDELKENHELQRRERIEDHNRHMGEMAQDWEERKGEIRREYWEEIMILLGHIEDRETYIETHWETLLTGMREFLWGSGGWLELWSKAAEAGELGGAAAVEFVQKLQRLLESGIPMWYIVQNLQAGLTLSQIMARWHGFQQGGYAPYGRYILGEAGREFVLSAPTVGAFEQALGPLSQESMLSLLGGGRSGRGGRVVSIEVNQENWTFAGTFTEGDKVWFRDAARVGAVEELNRLFQEVR